MSNEHFDNIFSVYPLKEVEGKDKKVISTCVFIPREGYATNKHKNFAELITDYYNGIYDKNFLYLTGLIKNVSTFKTRMGSDWIYRVYIDKMFSSDSSYNNIYNSQPDNTNNNKRIKSNINQNKIYMNTLIKMYQNYIKYIISNSSKFDNIEIFVYESTYYNKTHKKYLGLPETLGSIARFFCIFDPNVKVTYFMNVSHSISHKLKKLINEWYESDYTSLAGINNVYKFNQEKNPDYDSKKRILASLSGLKREYLTSEIKANFYNAVKNAIDNKMFWYGIDEYLLSHYILDISDPKCNIINVLLKKTLNYIYYVDKGKMSSIIQILETYVNRKDTNLLNYKKHIENITDENGEYEENTQLDIKIIDDLYNKTTELLRKIDSNDKIEFITTEEYDKIYDIIKKNNIYKKIMILSSTEIPENSEHSQQIVDVCGNYLINLIERNKGYLRFLPNDLFASIYKNEIESNDIYIDVHLQSSDEIKPLKIINTSPLIVFEDTDIYKKYKAENIMYTYLFFQNETCLQQIIQYYENPFNYSINYSKHTGGTRKINLKKKTRKIQKFHKEIHKRS